MKSGKFSQSGKNVAWIPKSAKSLQTAHFQNTTICQNEKVYN